MLNILIFSFLIILFIDEEKLKWAFRLYDLDNNGEIDIEEMTNIIETLDCIEGVQAGVVRYDENGHPVDTPSAKSRAEDLFLVSVLFNLSP